jgi:ribosomal protein S27E
MGCCSKIESDEKPNGECPDCGVQTLDGQAVDGCSYSPVECETCGQLLI